MSTRRPITPNQLSRSSSTNSINSQASSIGVSRRPSIGRLSKGVESSRTTSSATIDKLVKGYGVANVHHQVTIESPGIGFETICNDVMTKLYNNYAVSNQKSNIANRQGSSRYIIRGVLLEVNGGISVVDSPICNIFSICSYTHQPYFGYNFNDAPGNKKLMFDDKIFKIGSLQKMGNTRNIGRSKTIIPERFSTLYYLTILHMLKSSAYMVVIGKHSDMFYKNITGEELVTRYRFIENGYNPFQFIDDTDVGNASKDVNKARYISDFVGYLLYHGYRNSKGTNIAEKVINKLYRQTQQYFIQYIIVYYTLLIYVYLQPSNSVTYGDVEDWYSVLRCLLILHKTYESYTQTMGTSSSSPSSMLDLTRISPYIRGERKPVLEHITGLISKLYNGNDALRTYLNQIDSSVGVGKSVRGKASMTILQTILRNIDMDQSTFDRIIGSPPSIVTIQPYQPKNRLPQKPNNEEEEVGEEEEMGEEEEVGEEEEMGEEEEVGEEEEQVDVSTINEMMQKLQDDRVTPEEFYEFIHLLSNQSSNTYKSRLIHEVLQWFMTDPRNKKNASNANYIYYHDIIPDATKLYDYIASVSMGNPPQERCKGNKSSRPCIIPLIFIKKLLYLYAFYPLPQQQEQHMFIYLLYSYLGTYIRYIVQYFLDGPESSSNRDYSSLFVVTDSITKKNYPSHTFYSAVTNYLAFRQYISTIFYYNRSNQSIQSSITDQVIVTIPRLTLANGPTSINQRYHDVIRLLQGENTTHLNHKLIIKLFLQKTSNEANLIGSTLNIRDQRVNNETGVQGFVRVYQIVDAQFMDMVIAYLESRGVLMQGYPHPHLRRDMEVIQFAKDIIQAEIKDYAQSTRNVGNRSNRGNRDNKRRRMIIGIYRLVNKRLMDVDFQVQRADEDKSKSMSIRNKLRTLPNEQIYIEMVGVWRKIQKMLKSSDRDYLNMELPNYDEMGRIGAIQNFKKMIDEYAKNQQNSESIITGLESFMGYIQDRTIVEDKGYRRFHKVKDDPASAQEKARKIINNAGLKNVVRSLNRNDITNLLNLGELLLNGNNRAIVKKLREGAPSEDKDMLKRLLKRRIQEKLSIGSDAANPNQIKQVISIREVNKRIGK